ncbi:TetR/AcrR family transcriptional regulator [Acholeplasma laidlawii]|uniref:TetR/AcrR family transcriptional regulator n=1 Tax=Acholeplasma laidlawii TaxID=2148 RepID=UPI000315495B|nr:TetR/AcrR family transcriptional regulator [Acholeplasma laidlawii]
MKPLLMSYQEQTYDNINIQNIIKDASIPRGSFYQYFKDKDDMYQYFMTYIGQIKMIYFKDIFANHTQSFIERVEALYLAGLNFKRDYPKFVKAGEFMMSSPLYQDSEAVKQGFEQILGIYESWILKDQEKGLIRADINSKILAKIIMDFLNKVTIDSFIYHKLDETEWVLSIKAVLDIFKKGILNHV